MMVAEFDPYYRWLGIPPSERPVTHYRLLGLADFESNPDVIDSAADRQMAHVRSFQTGPRAALSQQLLKELADARLCLLNPQTKATYDQQLTLAAAQQVRPAETIGVYRPPQLEPIRAPDMEPYPLAPLSPEPGLAKRRKNGAGAWKWPALALAACLLLAIVAMAAVPAIWREWARPPQAGGDLSAKRLLQTDPGQESMNASQQKAAAVASPESASPNNETGHKPEHQSGETVRQSTTREQRLRKVLSDLRSSIVLRMTFDAETVTEAKVVQDLSGHDNHGLIHGATVVPGVRGEALNFQGRSYVDCGNAATLHPGNAFSISLWVNPSKGPEYPRVVSKVNSYQLRWHWTRSDPGPPQFAGFFGAVRAPRTPPFGKWHHVVVTFGRYRDRSSLRMYFDGALVAEQAPKTSKAAQTDGHLYLGVSGPGARYEHYWGLLDELTIFNRELTAAEVESLYRAVAPTAPRAAKPDKR